MSNNMRTPEEKEEIVKEYYLIGQAKICHKYNISKSVIWNWVKKYEEKGIKGLESKTGKSSSQHKNMGLHFRKPKNKIEELEIDVNGKIKCRNSVKYFVGFPTFFIC